MKLSDIWGRKVKIALIFLVIVIVFSIALRGFTPTGASIVEINKVARCLSDKNSVLYITNPCPECDGQIMSFGNAFVYISYIDCSTVIDECEKEGINSYPTWVINSKKYIGRKTLEELKEIANC